MAVRGGTALNFKNMEKTETNFFSVGELGAFSCPDRQELSGAQTRQGSRPCTADVQAGAGEVATLEEDFSQRARSVQDMAQNSRNTVRNSSFLKIAIVEELLLSQWFQRLNN